MNERQEDIIWPIKLVSFFHADESFLVWQKLSLVCNLSDAFYIFVAESFFFCLVSLTAGNAQVFAGFAFR
jgi:hypothetical protein